MTDPGAQPAADDAGADPAAVDAGREPAAVVDGAADPAAVLGDAAEPGAVPGGADRSDGRPGEPPVDPATIGGAAPAPHERHTLLALMDAVGGPAALVDSAAPTIVFALTYTLDSRVLKPAVLAAVAVAVVLAVWRVVRRQPLRTVAGGVLGIALAAGVAIATGRASDYYLVSVVRALGLALVYAVSALVRWPLIGVLVGAAAGRPGGFREDPEQLRAYTRVTWLWVGLFLLRLAVRGPLLLANAFTWLSVTDVVMGWPLFLAWTGLTYVLLRRWLHGSVWEAAREGILARNARTGGAAARARGADGPAPAGGSPATGPAGTGPATGSAESAPVTGSQAVDPAGVTDTTGVAGTLGAAADAARDTR